MQVAFKVQELCAAILLAIVLLIAIVATANDRPQRPEPPWAWLERHLTYQGIKTDTASLIEAAQFAADDTARWMAIEVLGLRGEQQAKEVLRKILAHDPNPILQESAALALARLKDEAGLSALKRFMQTSAVPQRQLYLAARLAELGDHSGYPLVAKAAGSDDAHLRYVAVGTLLAFVPVEAKDQETEIRPIERLITLADDKDPKVRKEVLMQFGLAVYKGVSIAHFRPTVERMAAKDPEAEVREWASRTLASWREVCRKDPSIPGCK